MTQVLRDTQQDNFCLEMTPLEWVQWIHESGGWTIGTKHTYYFDQITTRSCNTAGYTTTSLVFPSFPDLYKNSIVVFRLRPSRLASAPTPNLAEVTCNPCPHLNRFSLGGASEWFPTRRRRPFDPSPVFTLMSLFSPKWSHPLAQAALPPSGTTRCTAARS